MPTTWANQKRGRISLPWAASALLHLVGVLVLLSIPAPEDRTATATVVTPLVYRPEAPAQPSHAPIYAPIRVTRAPLIVRVETPQNRPLPKQLATLVPEPPRPRPAALQAPDPVLQAALPDVLPAPVRLKAPDLPSRPPTPAPVKTGVFGSAGEAPNAHVPAPVLEVRTGGFGGGQAPATSGNAPSAGVRTGGFGASQAPPASAPAPSPAVHTSAFGESTGSPSGNARPVVVATAGFGNAVAQSPVPRRTEAAATETPVEVLWKPKPLYTEEARAKKLEGNVTLEVVFRATGEVHVIRVVRGLGSGLDESARSAAEQIRFRPGKKDGVPVDRTGLVQITFELS